jgi:ribosomal protein S27AE
MKGTFKYIKNRLDNPEVQAVIDSALSRLATDLEDECISTTSERTRVVATLTGSPGLRWKMFLERASMKCPSCGNVLSSECARVVCGKCREDLMVRSSVLLGVCQGCLSFQDKECPGAMVVSRKFGKPQITSKRTGRVFQVGIRSESNE